MNKFLVAIAAFAFTILECQGRPQHHDPEMRKFWEDCKDEFGEGKANMWSVKACVDKKMKILDDSNKYDVDMIEERGEQMKERHPDSDFPEIMKQNAMDCAKKVNDEPDNATEGSKAAKAFAECMKEKRPPRE